MIDSDGTPYPDPGPIVAATTFATGIATDPPSATGVTTRLTGVDHVAEQGAHQIYIGMDIDWEVDASTDALMRSTLLITSDPAGSPFIMNSFSPPAAGQARGLQRFIWQPAFTVAKRQAKAYNVSGGWVFDITWQHSSGGGGGDSQTARIYDIWLIAIPQVQATQIEG
jgi:soluble lytic murein transglycosylase-like protein